MRYDISKASAPAMPNLKTGQNAPHIPQNFPLKSLQIVCQLLRFDTSSYALRSFWSFKNFMS